MDDDGGASRNPMPPTVRRVVWAYGLFHVAELASWVMILLHAFDEGGVAGTSAVVLVQLAPAAACAPFAGAVCSRFGAGRVLVAGYVVQSLLLAATALGILLGLSPIAVYGAAALAATAMTVTRPALAAALPGVCETASDLVRSNVALARMEASAAFLGPVTSFALTRPIGVGSGLLVVAGGPAVAALVSRRAREERASLATIGAGRGERARRASRLIGSPEALVLLADVALIGVVIGVVEVLAAPFAERNLGLGSAASGLVGGALGLGGIVGSLLLGRLTGGGGMARSLAGSLLAFGFGVAVSGRLATAAPALAALGVAGVGRALNDGAGRALTQRTVREDVIGHVFAVRESLGLAGLAIGGLAAIPLEAELGIERAIVAAGLAAVAGGVLVLPWVVRIDRRADVPAVAIALLRRLPIFAPLPPAPMEALARAAREECFDAGEVVIREGEIGERYYAIVSGRCSVVRDGRVCDQMGRGDGFGERSLLTDEPRNATIVCGERSVLLSIHGDAFLTAVTGHSPCAGRARLIAAARTHPRGDPARDARLDASVAAT